MQHPPELVNERLSARVDDRGGTAVVVEAPLRTPERSAYGQQRLRSTVYAGVTRPAYHSTVLLETFRGRGVGDSPGAICAELLRREAGLDLVWIVDDPSVTVPRGSRAVSRRTREWYDLLANARTYVANAVAPKFFAKKSGQLHVQTWHGTPLKRIGEDRGPGDLSTWRHRRTVARQAAGWDAMVSPSRYVSDVFRSAFGYAGEILEVGYPRNDALLAADAPAVRERTRARLNLGPQDRVVLYAPTWREYAGVRDAKPLYLDAVGLTRAAPDAVVLVRGHYNATGQRDVFRSHPRVHDVTRYPEIVDLFLAADVLVTDYSSVMVDVALIDKPIVILAPDLQYYRDVERGFYFDFEQRAPGPLVTTTDEVVAALRSEDAHASERAWFREQFCPLEDGHASARVVDWLLGRLG
jgi:CDP-glycerol glycerophosphotransferase